MLPTPASPPSGQNPTDRGSFVFNGTVQQMNAATMEHLPVDARTARVRVDEVLQAPDILRRIAGQEITVYTGDIVLEPGEQATFYTEGLVFGDSIAVHAREVRRAEEGGAAAAPGAPADPADNLRAQRAEERFTSADLVVKGRVKAVEEAEPDAEPEISEHAPVWMKAVIEVEEVYTGDSGPGRTVEIRFPASTDVMWHRAPKFQPGQEGVFILRRELSDAPAEELAAAASEGEIRYTALDPADFHSAESPHIIESVLSKLTTTV